MSPYRDYTIFNFAKVRLKLDTILGGFSAAAVLKCFMIVTKSAGSAAAGVSSAACTVPGARSCTAPS